MKKIHPLLIAAVLVLSGLFFFSLVRATTAEYLQAVVGYKGIYDRAILQAESQYKTVVDAADKIEADSLKTVSSQLSAKQISEDEYDSKVTNIQTSHKQTVDQAESILTANRKIAFQNYQGQRDYAWNKYVLGQNPILPPSTPLATSTPPTPSPPPVATSTPPVSVPAIPLSAMAFPVRYSLMCGVPTSLSLNPGETKYYKVDMTKWIDWQRAYWNLYRGHSIPNHFSSCSKICADSVEVYSASHCDPATGSPEMTWCLANPSECARACWLGTCRNKPKPLEVCQAECATTRDKEMNDANDALAAKEALFASGSFSSFMNGNIFFGCSGHTSDWGCGVDIWRTPFRIAIGADRMEKYEDISQFVKKNDVFASDFFGLYYRDEIMQWVAAHASYISECKNNPLTCAFNVFMSELANRLFQEHILAVEQNTQVSDFEFVMFSANIKDANEIYFMVHNFGTEKRDYAIGFDCPDAKAR
ncbi:MAG: hypothetical protein V1845_00460 [bacterium]